MLRALLAQQRAACETWLADQREQLARADAPYAALVLQFRIGQIESILRWLDLCEATALAPDVALAPASPGPKRRAPPPDPA
jgi:hypothetical protein